MQRLTVNGSTVRVRNYRSSLVGPHSTVATATRADRGKRGGQKLSTVRSHTPTKKTSQFNRKLSKTLVSRLWTAVALATTIITPLGNCTCDTRGSLFRSNKCQTQWNSRHSQIQHSLNQLTHVDRAQRCVFWRQSAEQWKQVQMSKDLDRRTRPQYGSRVAGLCGRCWLPQQ